MARTPMVTRTITTSVVSVLCADIVLGELKNIEFTLPRTYKNEEDILKAVRKANTDENIRPVSVADVNIVETLYGMSEQDFINGARVLPPRTGAVESTDEE